MKIATKYKLHTKCSLMHTLERGRQPRICPHRSAIPFLPWFAFSLLIHHIFTFLSHFALSIAYPSLLYLSFLSTFPFPPVPLPSPTYPLTPSVLCPFSFLPLSSLSFVYLSSESSSVVCKNAGSSQWGLVQSPGHKCICVIIWAQNVTVSRYKKFTNVAKNILSLSVNH